MVSTNICFSKVVLNKELYKIVKWLNELNINEWFVGYGTLLGIIRHNSCIDQDDDIDILINIKYKNDILEYAKNNNYIIALDRDSLLSIKSGENAPLIDFYGCNVENNNYHDLWENALWKNINPISTIDFNIANDKLDTLGDKGIIRLSKHQDKWSTIKLNIPYQPWIKLRNRYGDEWYIPKPDIKTDIFRPFISELGECTYRDFNETQIL